MKSTWTTLCGSHAAFAKLLWILVYLYPSLDKATATVRKTSDRVGDRSLAPDPVPRGAVRCLTLRCVSV